MKANKSKSKPQRVVEAPAITQATTPSAVPPVPDPEAFLEQALQEPKRILLTDHIKTIETLRDKKKFTFRAIADWLNARGIEADHSAVYRAYLRTIPEDMRDPREDWSDVELPD